MPDGPIAIYLPELTPGGAQRVTVDLANGLAQRGHPVHLVVSYPGGQLRPEVEPEVTIVDLGTPFVPGIGIGASTPALIRYLRRRRPIVLFSAMTYANVVATLAARLSRSGTPNIPVEHTTAGLETGGKRNLTARLARWLYPLAARVIAVSDGVAESVRARSRVDPGAITVLPNPVPVETLRERADAPVEDPWLTDPAYEVILWVGRFAPEKDLPTLVAAFDHLHRDRPATRLILAGTGPKRAAIEELVSDRGLDDVVTFPGFVDPAPYMSRAAVFALSSTREGLPTVLIEALAVGCPVVATDCPSGPREILADGATGRLVPVGDAVALAEAIAATLDDDIDEVGLRDRADAYASDTVLQAYESLIESVLAEAG